MERVFYAHFPQQDLTFLLSIPISEQKYYIVTDGISSGSKKETKGSHDLLREETAIKKAF